MMHALLAVISMALAQPADQLAAELAMLESRAGDQELSLEQRRVDAARAIDLRRELLRRGIDPRRGLMMIDQAGALLARLGDDGADTAVMFEADLFDQRRRVVEGVGEAIRLIEGAPEALNDGIDELDAAGDVAGASDLRAAQRDIRLDFFDARSSLLASSLAEGEERRRLGLHAVRVSADLELEGSAEAARLTTMGLGALFAGEVAAAEAALRAALEMTEGGQVPRAVWCEAVVGMALCESSRGDVDRAVRRLDGALTSAPVVVDGRADAALGIVVLGVRARMLLEAGLADEAFDAHVRTWRFGFPGVEARASRSLVLESMALASEEISDVSVLAPEVGFARGVLLSRDPDSRREAIELLGEVAARPDAGSLAGEALWEQAVLLLQGGEADIVAGVESLADLAARLPGSTRAPAALEAALAYGHQLAAAGVSSPAYDEALDLVREGRPSIDNRSFWLLERARREIRAGRLSGALSTLELIAPADPRSQESETLYGAAVRARIDELWSHAHAARAEGREDDVRRIAKRELVPLAVRAVAFARDRDLAWVGPMRADLADARTEAGEAGARVLYQRLIEDDVSVPGGEVRLRLGLARSLLVADERERAFARLREVTAIMGDTPPDEARDRFWHAWTLVVEMLAEENADGARSGVIHAHIVRLETIDPQLGGPPWRARIDAVRSQTP